MQPGTIFMARRAQRHPLSFSNSLSKKPAAAHRFIRSDRARRRAAHEIPLRRRTFRRPRLHPFPLHLSAGITCPSYRVEVSNDSEATRFNHCPVLMLTSSSHPADQKNGKGSPAWSLMTYPSSTAPIRRTCRSGGHTLHTSLAIAADRRTGKALRNRIIGGQPPCHT